MWENVQPPVLDAGGFMALPSAAGLQAAAGAIPTNVLPLPQLLPPTGLPPFNFGLLQGFSGSTQAMQFSSAPGLMPSALSMPQVPNFGTMPIVSQSSICGATNPGDAGSTSVVDSKKADTAKGVITGAPTTASAIKTQLDSSKSISPPTKRAKQIGSLLAAYAEDESSTSENEEERKDSRCDEASSKPKVALAACAWEPWQDVLVPRRRHGLVVGRPPSELISSWPRELEGYPAGHAPANPPGCCLPQCTCMDGTRRPEEWELRKAWLDGEAGASDGRTRSMAASKALSTFAEQAFVLKRGRNSKQHFLEAVSKNRTLDSAPGSEGQACKPSSCVEKLRSTCCELEAIAELAAASMRDALSDISSGDVMGAGLRIPVAAVLPPGKLYEPFRVEAPNSPASMSSSAGLSARGLEVRALGEQSVPNGAVQELRLLLPEGELLAIACRVGAGGFEVRDRLTSQIAKRIDVLPWQFRLPLLEALSGIWDLTYSTMLQDIQFRDWLRVMERVHLQARSAAASHVVDLGQQGAEALRAPSFVPSAPSPCFAMWGTGPGIQLEPKGAALPGWLAPPGFQSGPPPSSLAPPPGFLPSPPGPPPFSLAPPPGFPPVLPSGTSGMEFSPGFPPGFPPGMEFPVSTMPAGPQWREGPSTSVGLESMSKARFAVSSPPGPLPGVPPQQSRRPPGPPSGAPPGAPPVSFKGPPSKPSPPWREVSFSKSAPPMQVEGPLPASDPIGQTAKAMPASMTQRFSSQVGSSELASDSPSGRSTPSI